MLFYQVYYSIWFYYIAKCNDAVSESFMKLGYIAVSKNGVRSAIFYYIACISFLNIVI